MRDGRRQRLGIGGTTTATLNAGEDPGNISTSGIGSLINMGDLYTNSVADQNATTGNQAYLDRILDEEGPQTLNLDPGAYVDTRDNRYVQDAYNYYLGGGTGEVPTDTAEIPGAIDTLVDVGDSGEGQATSGLGLGDITPANTDFEQGLLDQGIGVQAEPGAPISAPGEGMLTQEAIDDLADYPLTTDFTNTGDASIAEQIAAKDRAAKARADEQALTNQEQYRTGQYTPTETYAGGDISLADTGVIGDENILGQDYFPDYNEPQSQLASEMIAERNASQPVGLNARGTIDRTVDPDFYSDQETEVDNYPQTDSVDYSEFAPYGINPNTGEAYQTPRSISDQNAVLGQTFAAEDVDAQGNLLQSGIYKMKSIFPDFNPIVAAGKIAFNSYIGAPVTLVFDALKAIGGMLPDGIKYTTNKARETGLLQGDSTVTQDIYGINTQSMFGDYNQYNIDRVEQLGAKINKTPRDITELQQRQDYIESSGADGNIAPAATPTDIATGNITGDASVAEDIAFQDSIDAGIQAADDDSSSEMLDQIESDQNAQNAQNARDAAAAANAAATARAAADLAASQRRSGGGNGGGQGDQSGGRSSSSGESGYGGFCFDPSTPIQMADGSTKEIKNIQLGDDTKGGEVTGVFQFKASDDIHNYKGITVAGGHYVKENNEFIMVKDSPLAVKMDKIPVVYSLDTSARRIFIKDIEFADYNGDGVAKNFLSNAGVTLKGFDKEVLRQVQQRLI
jgi:hypothetical protein